MASIFVSLTCWENWACCNISIVIVILRQITKKGTESNEAKYWIECEWFYYLSNSFFTKCEITPLRSFYTDIKTINTINRYKKLNPSRENTFKVICSRILEIIKLNKGTFLQVGSKLLWRYFTCCDNQLIQPNKLLSGRSFRSIYRYRTYAKANVFLKYGFLNPIVPNAPFH